MTVEAFLREQTAAEQQKGAQALATLAETEETLDEAAPFAPAPVETVEDEEETDELPTELDTNATDEQIAAVWNGSKQIRDEFVQCETFAALVAREGFEL